MEGHPGLAYPERTEVGDGESTFDVPDSTVTRPGEATIVVPRKDEIHAIYSPARSGPPHPIRRTECGYVLEDERADEKANISSEIYGLREFEFREFESVDRTTSEIEWTER